MCNMVSFVQRHLAAAVFILINIISRHEVELLLNFLTYNETWITEIEFSSNCRLHLSLWVRLLIVQLFSLSVACDKMLQQYPCCSCWNEQGSKEARQRTGSELSQLQRYQWLCSAVNGLCLHDLTYGFVGDSGFPHFPSVFFFHLILEENPWK